MNQTTMNEPTAPAATTPQSKPPRKRSKLENTAPPKTRTPKTLDPRIKAQREVYLKSVQAIRAEDASARMLRVIIEKRLPKMTRGDKLKLFDELAAQETPNLPFKPLAPLTE